MRLFTAILSAFAACCVACQDLQAAIVTSGYSLQQYASVTDPRALSFDASGNLYAGRDNFGSGGGFGDAIQILLVAPDLSVSPFGSAIADPDLLIVDRTGSITGFAGSVIVGGSGGSGTTKLSAIHPDQSTVQLLNTNQLSDVNGLAFNSLNQLVIGDGLGLSLYDGTSITRLASLSVAVDSIGVDSTDRIFATTTDNTLKIFSSTGTLLDDSFVSGRYLRFAFGQGGGFGTDLYGVDQLTGELVHLSTSGDVDVIGSGFGNSFVTFGNDGAMYVSEFDNDRVLRIQAVPEPTSLAIWGGIGLIGLVAGWRRKQRIQQRK